MNMAVVNNFLSCQKLANSKMEGGTKPYNTRAKAVFNHISS